MPQKLPSAARILATLLVFACSSNAATITDNTLAAWNNAKQQACERLTSEALGQIHVLPVDRKHESPEDPLSFGGLAIVSPHSKGQSASGGLIHHWIGTVFIRDANAADVVSTLQNYDAYRSLFAPALVDSLLLARSQDTFLYRLKFIQKEFGVGAALVGDFHSTYSRGSIPGTGYSITEANRLNEIRNPGTPDEQVIPFAASHGYVEKMFTVVRYRETGGGTYVQVETLVLSRDIPAPLRWAVSPLVRRFARETMTATLDRLRTGVTETHSLNTLAMAHTRRNEQWRISGNDRAKRDTLF